MTQFNVHSLISQGHIPIYKYAHTHKIYYITVHWKIKANHSSILFDVKNDLCDNSQVVIGWNLHNVEQ